MWRTVSIVAVLAVAAFVSPSATGEPGDRDATLTSIIAEAAGVPPEFSADALIRVAGSAKVVDRSWKRELLDDAFLRAYAAPVDVRRISSTVPPESRQFAEREAADTPLARIALQSRAVQMMAAVDPPRAIELFEWIDLSLAPASCGGMLVPVADEYYLTASVLARTAFPRDRGEALRFLEYYLWRAHLPTELAAVALAVDRFRPTPAEATQLEGLLTSLMDAGSSDPRGFSVANADIVGRFADLQFADRNRNVPGWFLVEAVRKYLTSHLGGPRCSDSTTESTVPATFNLALKLLGADLEVKPIDANAIRPSRLLTGASIDFLWQTGESRRLFDDWMELRGRGRDPLPGRDRRTDTWRTAAERFITDVDEWTGRSEASERDYLYEKATLYYNIIGLTSPGTIRVRAIRSLTAFLRHENNDRSRRPLWFVFVGRLLDLSRSDARHDVLDAMEGSGDPVLSLYARLERIVPSGQRKR